MAKIVEGGNFKKDIARSCFLLPDRHRGLSGGGLVLTGRPSSIVPRQEGGTRNLSKKDTESAQSAVSRILGGGQGRVWGSIAKTVTTENYILSHL